MEAPNEKARKQSGKESGKEIGTRAGRGIDIDVPGGDGDGTKGGRGSRRSSGAGGRDTNTLKIRFITFLLRFRGGTTKGCPG